MAIVRRPQLSRPLSITLTHTRSLAGHHIGSLSRQALVRCPIMAYCQAWHHYFTLLTATRMRRISNACSLFVKSPASLLFEAFLSIRYLLLARNAVGQCALLAQFTTRLNTSNSINMCHIACKAQQTPSFARKSKSCNAG